MTDEFIPVQPLTKKDVFGTIVFLAGCGFVFSIPFLLGMIANHNEKPEQSRGR